MNERPKKRAGWFRRATHPVTGSPPGQATERALGSVRRWVRTAWTREDAEPTSLIQHKVEGNDAAVVFIHGFGSSGVPFGRFPEILAAEPALQGWDLYALGYSTGLMPDVRGFWEADPSIPLLANYLRDGTRLAPLDGYEGLALVAHSMGGLVVQQALLDDPELADRVSHVVMFGTPSDGLRTARWGGFLKQQIEDMAEGGAFITDLRRRWNERFGAHRPFDLWVVAGDRDRFVPAELLTGPVPARDAAGGARATTWRSSTSAVPDSMSEQVVVEGLLGDAAPAGPWNSARVAVEQQRVRPRHPRSSARSAGELDEQHLVDLALALEATGRREEAIAILTRARRQARHRRKGDARRAAQAQVAGRGRQRDAESALELYSRGPGGRAPSRRRRSGLLPRDQRRLPRARLPRRPKRRPPQPPRRALEACGRARRATGDGHRGRGAPLPRPARRGAARVSGRGGAGPPRTRASGHLPPGAPPDRGSRTPRPGGPARRGLPRRRSARTARGRVGRGQACRE